MVIKRRDGDLCKAYRPQTFSDIVGQTAIVKSVRASILSGNRSQCFLFHGETGAGKAQPYDAIVYTPDGPIKMGEITKGTQVCTPDGGTAVVVGIFEQGEKEIFRVSFSDGTSTECCLDHLWKVKTRLDRNKGRGYSIIPLDEIKNNIVYQCSDKNYSNYSIPMTKPVDFNKKNLNIDPYVMGVLLGDGNFSEYRNVKLSTSDTFIVDYFDSYLSSLDMKTVKINKNRYDYRLVKKERSNKKNVLVEELKRLGLAGKKSPDKFVPYDYKYSNVEDRISLLQGLMDSDGTVSLKRAGKSCCVSFSSTSEVLSTDLAFLVESLGGKVKISKRRSFFTYKGIKKEGRLSFRAHISLPKNIVPFRLQRKLDLFVPRHKYTPSRFVKSVDLVGKKLCRCIYIDHPDHLYLTDRFIVTHNTTLSRIVAMALNCEDRHENGDPCCVCSSCINIASSSHPECKEIDSADVGGIDQVRKIRNDFNTRPMFGKVKVYIFDEAHRITPPAQNALLKGTEDMPDDIYVILCSTEPKKIIKPLRGRCEAYDFKRLSNTDIAHLIGVVSICEGTDLSDVDSRILTSIIDVAAGRPRNALKALQKVLNIITEPVDDILQIIGFVDEADKETIDLCRLLTASTRPSWQQIIKVYKSINAEQESIRIVLAGWFRSLLERSKTPSSAVKASKALEFFVYDSPLIKPENKLVLNLYRAYSLYGVQQWKKN